MVNDLYENRVKISVIMPLYNAERYLEESLESVLRQTFSDFELICINDGSTDNTANILESYLEQDSRIKVLSNEERFGAAFSRNKGMSVAKGKYLSFLDGDDIFDPSMLELAFENAERYQSDIEMFSAKHVPSDKIHQLLYMPHSDEYINRYCNRTFTLKDSNSYESLIWSLEAWNKLFRREFVFSNGIEFQNLSCCNDVYFVYMLLLLAERLHVVNDNRIMVYVRDHSEVSRISYHRDPRCVYYAMERIGTELQQRGAEAYLWCCFYWCIAYSIIGEVCQCRDSEQARTFCKFMKNEGIQNLISLGGEFYKSVDAYVKELFGNFLTKSYESEWYRKENVLKFFLTQNQDLVEGLFKSYQDSGKKIGIWGAGLNGQILIHFCNEHKIILDAVIDCDKGKQNTIFEGYKISSFEEGINQVQVIVVASQYIYEDVKNTIELSGGTIEAIDINQVLQIS